MDLINSEPWFNDKLDLKEDDEWDKEKEIIWNQNYRNQDKHQFFIRAFDFISDNRIIGDYHEFGCHRARTFRMVLLEAKRHFLKDMYFYAYDSFEGLPESSSNHDFDQRWKAGALSTSESDFIKLIKESNLFNENINLFKGFYDQSLKNINLNIYSNKKASLINIDCDLYESAVPIFDFIDNILQEGTILYIDDYFTGYKGNPTKGVSGALKEWNNNSKWNLESYRDVGWAGRSYIVY